METYKTIDEASAEVLYKEKNSRFFAYAFPIVSEEEVKPILEQLRKQHHGAVHFCYAWQIGTENTSYRANDDGEPSNSAGMPIYGQIQSFGVTNVMVVVVRFFGGVKLGVGGLIAAYRTAARMAFEASNIVTRTIDVTMTVGFEYAQINKVMRVIREKNLKVLSQSMELACEITVSAPKAVAESAAVAFSGILGVRVIVPK